MKIITSILGSALLIILLGFFMVFPIEVMAESEETSPYAELADALDRELNEIYIPYSDLVDSDTLTTEEFVVKFEKDITTWYQVFLSTEQVYKKHSNNSDYQIAEIASKGLLANQEGKKALDLYRQAYLEEDEVVIARLFTEGDSAFNSAVIQRDEVVDLYNNYSGASSSYNARDILIFSSIISAILTLIIFLKSRNKTTIDAEIIKAEIYKRLSINALWMTIGLAVTAVGLAYAINSGGTYYILWGPVVFGGWAFMKGLFNYFVNDRKILASLASEQRAGAIKQSYFEETTEHPIKTLVKCPHCGEKQSRHTIICNNCGNNLL